VTAEREGQALRVVVADDGGGLPEMAGAGSGLGTQIVSTLVANELRGSIEWGPREGSRGTQVVLEAVLRNPSRESAGSM
jgi:two-component sensor histidine kinase